MGPLHDMRTLTISGNELRAHAVKAARGLGYDWGRAKYIGEAILRAQRHGLNGLESFLALIDNLNTGPSQLTHTMLRSGSTVSLNAIDLGVSMADALALLEFQKPTSFIVRGCPLFLGLLCYGLTGSNRALHVVVDTASCIIQDNSIIMLANKPGHIAHQGLCSITACTPSKVNYASMSRFELDNNQARLLDQFASRVYAPATEISRLSGAGAGLQDND